MKKINMNKLNNNADSLISSIDNIITKRISTAIKVDSAVIKRVNSNGTVDIYFPPDEKSEFTQVSNQCPFELQAGDSVEVMVKDGTYSNCWVVAKHQDTYECQNTFKKLFTDQITIWDKEKMYSQSQIHFVNYGDNIEDIYAYSGIIVINYNGSVYMLDYKDKDETTGNITLRFVNGYLKQYINATTEDGWSVENLDIQPKINKNGVLIGTGSGGIDVLDLTGVLKGAGSGSVETIDVDTEPTEDSTNLVTSGGVYAAIHASMNELIQNIKNGTL